MDPTTITAFVGLIVAATGAFSVWNGRKIHTELKTINSLKVGELADADETRRVEAIPHDDRTTQEQDHLDASPALGPAQGPRPTVRERTEAIYEAVNGKPSDQPSLYDMVQTLDLKVDHIVERVDRIESYIGGDLSESEPTDPV